jgi:hypothetical protein
MRRDAFSVKRYLHTDGSNRIYGSLHDKLQDSGFGAFRHGLYRLREEDYFLYELQKGNRGQPDPQGVIKAIGKRKTYRIFLLTMLK